MVLGWLAALFFAIAFIFNGAGVSHGTWLSATSFALLGLVFLALHFVLPVAVPAVRRAPGA